MLSYNEYRGADQPSYKHYKKKLHSACEDVGANVLNLGMDIQAIVLNAGEGRPTVCFSAGIHGDEIAGPWGVVRFINQLKEFELGNNRVIIIPVANPTGFDKGTRRNKDNFDLNRHGCHKELDGEVKVLYDFMIDEGVDMLVTLHEDDTIDNFFIYHSINAPSTLLQTLLGLGKRYFPVYGKGSVHGVPIKNGLASFKKMSKDCTLEDRMFKEGIPYICTETPGDLDLNKRIELTCELMKAISNHEEIKSTRSKTSPMG